MKSEGGAVQRGYSGTTQQRDWIPAGCLRWGTSFAFAHVTHGPLNRIGNWKRPLGVLPLHSDREKKVHPIMAGVKLATRREMRHPEHQRQRASHRAQSARPSSPSCHDFLPARRKVLSIVGSARRATPPPASPQAAPERDKPLSGRHPPRASPPGACRGW